MLGAKDRLVALEYQIFTALREYLAQQASRVQMSAAAVAAADALCSLATVAVQKGYCHQETTDFYRWTEVYDREALSELIERRSGVRIGRLISIEPLERGLSGRIIKLKIIGEDKTLIVGKELEIRRILSESHLKSSAFEVRYDADTIILDGKGWGHGVGLCQIGAAVMASKGYGYIEILEHYYPGTVINEN